MKMNDIVTAVNQSSKRLGFSIKKKSPELLIAAGIIGFGGAIITACVATTKAGKIIEETQDALGGINDAHEKGVTNAGELYDDRDHKRDLTIIYVQTGLKFAKLYAPTAILAVSSITCVLSSHRILKKRNLALAAAYAAVDQSFKDYRGRVLDRFGEQVEKELRYNLKPAEIEETVTDDKGKEKKVKKTVDMMDPSTDIRSISPYAVVFESTHEDWSKDKTTNEWYIKARQSQLNSKLRSQGHLFLNEVYDALGFPRTAVGIEVKNMSKRKQIAFVAMLCITIAFAAANVIGLFHSVWFAFTNMHLTRMEMVFNPANKILLKFCLLLGFCISGKILSAICKS